MGGPGFRVDPVALRAAVTTVSAAAAELDRASDCVEHAHDVLQAGSTLDQGSDADNRIEAFRGRWKDELDLIKDMMTATGDALLKAADGYASAEGELAGAFDQQRAALRSGGGGRPRQAL